VRYSSRADGSNSIFSGAVTVILRFLVGGAMASFARAGDVWYVGIYSVIRVCLLRTSQMRSWKIVAGIRDPGQEGMCSRNVRIDGHC
jgi:hypothetical protein